MENQNKIDKNEKIDLKQEFKIFLKISLPSFVIYLILIELIKFCIHNNYKDNIYYEDRLIISDEKISGIEEKLTEKIGKSINRDDNALVLNAVFENDNLTDDEKELIYECVDLLNENPYLNKTTAYNYLNKLDIEYDSEADYGENIAGVYQPGNNRIIIKNDNDKKEIVRHEIIHCIYEDDCYEALPIFFREGMTELLTNEYFCEKPFTENKSYPYEILMVKILCELVGPDNVLETYSTRNMEIIEKKLKENKINNPKEFLNNMQNISMAISKEEKANIKDVNNILLELDNYYKDIDTNSIEYQIYLYNIESLGLTIKENPTIEYEIMQIEKGYFVKPYFSKELKKKYPEVYCSNYYENLKVKSKKKQHFFDNEYIK